MLTGLLNEATGSRSRFRPNQSTWLPIHEARAGTDKFAPNAAKFTDPGGHIYLSGELESEQVVVRVRDNGRGIDPQRLPVVFDMRRPLDARASPGIGGLGIGLALVKSLVELHGGSVAAFSDGPLAGAEFVVRLPAGDAASNGKRS